LIAQLRAGTILTSSVLWCRTKTAFHGTLGTKRHDNNICSRQLQTIKKESSPVHRRHLSIQRNSLPIFIDRIKMATRVAFENSNEIGVFAALTNGYCLTGELVLRIERVFYMFRYCLEGVNH